MIYAIVLLSLVHAATAICGAGIAPCGDDAIIACDAGWICDPSPFDDPPFTGCCIEAPTDDPSNPVDPNNPGSGTTKPSVQKTTPRLPVTHPVSTCRNTISDAECEQNKKLCTNQYYQALMAQQCAATCGCNGLYPAAVITTQHAGIPLPATTTVRSTTHRSAPPLYTDCYDLVNSSTGVTDCPQFSYMCNDKVYYNFMTQQCPLTCGRCQPGR